ncbi:MAG: RNA polymerase sigma factor RpoD/SigA [Nitrospinae bacterium]|nr:RNA polymerase sigma factor RpoD/SigA [Nitrospinota bacterium]
MPRSPRDEDVNPLQAYLKDIRGIHPLTREEEVTLARTKTDAALGKLVERNLKYVVKVAHRYKGMGLSLTDLINEGNIGLMEAARRFDPERGVKFITYAVWWIRQSILQALSDQARIVRLPAKQAGLIFKVARAIEDLAQKLTREPTREELAAALGIKEETLLTIMRVYRNYMSLDTPLSGEDTTEFIDMLESETATSVEEDFIQLCLRHDIEKLLGGLDARGEKVLRLRFGFDGPPMTLEQIGGVLGLTRERIRQLEKEAKRKLMTLAGIKALEEYLR